MTNMNPLLEKSNPSLDKKHNYPLRFGATERVLSPSNIQSPPKTMKGKNSNKDPMRTITDDHLNLPKTYQEEVGRKVEDNDSERRD